METKEITLPEDWEVKEIVDNKIIIGEKEKELPKTWKECINGFGEYGTITVLSPVENADAVRALGKLLVCRNVWWKQLGWKPDWKDEEVKYCITNALSRVSTTSNYENNRILAFPTEEIRYQFLESFRDLIEEAKELL